MRNSPQTEPRPSVGAHISGYGQGQATISLQEMLRLDPEALAERLIELFQSPRYQPPVLPAAATQILRLSTNPDVELKELVEVLGTDPLLMGRVTTTAQSPLYAGGNGQVRTLQEAVRRLGIRGLRNIVLEAAMQMRVFRTPAYMECMETIRRHSIVAAHMSHLTARFVRVDPNEAFLAGLMHDAGLAGGLLVLADGKRKEDAPSLSRYWASLERAHVAGGAAMVRLWGLPEDLARTLGLHHAPVTGGRLDPMAGCVCLGEHLAQLLGARVQYDATGGAGARMNDADVTDPAFVFTVRDAFKLSSKQMQDLFEAAKALYPLVA